MKNKLIIMALILNLLITSDAACILKVISLDEFNTKEPSEKLNIQPIKDYTLGGYDFKMGDTIECNVVKVVHPRRGKGNAKFYLEPYAYISGDNEEKTIDINMKGKYIKNVISKEELAQIDKKEIMKKAALKAGSTYAKMTVPGFSIVEGMVRNEEGNIIKSGIKGAYKNTPLVYLEKGKDVYLKPGDAFCLLFKKVKTDKKVQNEETEETEDNIDESAEEESNIEEIQESMNE